eukprot:COSAG01_NODE_6234_length_3776_cov_65.869731_3_plen_46_part_00
MCLINKINMETNMENWVDNVCYNFGNLHSLWYTIPKGGWIDSEIK